MSYRGIKRVLGESNLERKIRIWFGICLLVLIGGSFYSVNYITEDLIHRNILAQANSCKSDHILRTHLKHIKNLREEESKLFKSLATEQLAIPYQAIPVVLDDGVVRSQIGDRVDRWQPTVVTDSTEYNRLKDLVQKATELQEEQNELEALKIPDRETYQEKLQAFLLQEAQPPEDSKPLGVEFPSGEEYIYYTPVIFNSKSACIDCHLPIAKDPVIKARLVEIETLLARKETTDQEQILLNTERLNLAPPMFLKIALDNKITQEAITQSRAILVSVAIVTAVLSMAVLWIVVRYVIVKPLAHLRDVTDEVSQGRMDVRAEVNTGDEFEELSRSFNRMLRHLLDTQLALQGANRDLDSKVDEQAQLNLKLYEMNQIKSEFLANMSHELRTPLNSIIGFSEILENAKGLEGKQKRFASNICNSGRLLLDLINDILDLAKLEAGKMEVNPTEFQVNQLVVELTEMVRNLADSKNIQLSCEVPENLPDAEQDKIKLRQILTNLLSNAIKFTPEGGRIYVTVERLDSRPEQLKIQVRDTGVGIAEGDQSIVFEKFRQGPSAIGRDALTREVSGTGLGLSIVKELCILLGGRIDLQSEVGKGSTFTVLVPWVYQATPKINSEISQTINELTKNHRVDFGRANLTPTPDQDDVEASQTSRQGDGAAGGNGSQTSTSTSFPHP